RRGFLVGEGVFRHDRRGDHQDLVGDGNDHLGRRSRIHVVVVAVAVASITGSPDPIREGAGCSSRSCCSTDSPHSMSLDRTKYSAVSRVPKSSSSPSGRVEYRTNSEVWNSLLRTGLPMSRTRMWSLYRVGPVSPDRCPTGHYTSGYARSMLRQHGRHQ